MPMSKKLSLHELDTFLWQTADILRGNVEDTEATMSEYLKEWGIDLCKL